jgi:hypothetical protein
MVTEAAPAEARGLALGSAVTGVASRVAGLATATAVAAVDVAVGATGRSADEQAGRSSKATEPAVAQSFLAKTAAYRMRLNLARHFPADPDVPKRRAG